jgi:hypothetical protein
LTVCLIKNASEMKTECPYTRIMTALIISIVFGAGILIQQGFHVNRSGSNGFVCDALDIPGIRLRSEAVIHFKQHPAPAQTLIILAYIFDALGTDNLQYFLAQGLVNDSKYHFVLVVNGPTPLEWMPKLNAIASKYANFEWHQHQNIGYDFCIYRDALTNMKLRISIQHTRYFILLNKSLRGPFVTSYYDKPWPEIFTSRLNDMIRLSGTSINCGDKRSAGLHVQSMLWAFSSDSLSFMLERLKCFGDKDEAIHNIEIGLPSALMARGFRFASTMLMLSAKEGIPDANTAAICAWSANSINGDHYYPGAYAGIDMNPLEMVFFKSNRDVSPLVLRQYSIFSLMNNNFTVPAKLICG